MKKRIRRLVGKRRERRGVKKIVKALSLIETRLRRLGYQESAIDHVSRLHMPDDTLAFVLESGYSTITQVEEAIFTSSGIFRKRWGVKSGFKDQITSAVKKAIIEYREMRLHLLHNKLAKD